MNNVKPAFFDCVIDPRGNFLHNLHQKFFFLEGANLFKSRQFRYLKVPKGCQLDPKIIPVQRIDAKTSGVKRFLITTLKIAAWFTVVFPIAMFALHAMDYLRHKGRYRVMKPDAFMPRPKPIHNNLVPEQKPHQSEASSVPSSSKDQKENIQVPPQEHLFRKHYEANHALAQRAKFVETGDMKNTRFQQEKEPHFLASDLQVWMKRPNLLLDNHSFENTRRDTVKQRIQERTQKLIDNLDFVGRLNRAFGSYEFQSLFKLSDLESPWESSALRIGLLTQAEFYALTLSEVKSLNKRQLEIFEHLLREAPLPAEVNPPNQGVALDDLSLGQLLHIKDPTLLSSLNDIPSYLLGYLNDALIPWLPLTPAAISQSQFDLLIEGLSKNRKIKLLSEEQVKRASNLFTAATVGVLNDNQFLSLEQSKMSELCRFFVDKKRIGLLDKMPVQAYADHLDLDIYRRLDLAQTQGCIPFLNPERIQHLSSKFIPQLDLTKMSEEQRRALVNHRDHVNYLTPDQVRFCLQEKLLNDQNIQHLPANAISLIKADFPLAFNNLLQRELKNIADTSPEVVNMCLQEGLLSIDHIRRLTASQLPDLKVERLTTQEQVAALEIAICRRGGTLMNQYSDSQLNQLLDKMSGSLFRLIDPNRYSKLDWSRVNKEQFGSFFNIFDLTILEYQKLANNKPEFFLAQFSRMNATQIYNLPDSIFKQLPFDTLSESDFAKLFAEAQDFSWRLTIRYFEKSVVANRLLNLGVSLSQNQIEICNSYKS